MKTTTCKPRALALALLAGLGMSGTVLAQDVVTAAEDQVEAPVGAEAAQATTAPPPALPPVPPAPATPSTVPAPPAPPMAQTAIATGADAEVTFTSSPSNSVVGEYAIDFAAMDSNGDGGISRAEARSNATLTAEYAAVDIDSNGRLSKSELQGWM